MRIHRAADQLPGADPVLAERQAIAATMIPLAEYLTELGWDTRFSDLSEQQVFQLINVVVGGYQADMAQQMKEIPF